MKSATVAFGLLSGLASASYHHPRQFHQYFRRDNATAYPTEAPSTTLTVDITTTKTITSCAPTVTNCPVHGNGTAVVTEVIELTTTVCPVTEAASISSSVIAGHNSGLIPGSTSTVEPAGGYPTAYPSVGVTSEVLSVTVGPTSSQSVLVTTIQSTYTTWQTVTTDAAGNGGGEGGEPTTTTTQTSTGTRYVTVEPIETSANSPEGGEGSGEGSGESGAEGDCPVATTVTVTETQPASTVYITGTNPGASSPTGGAEYEGGEDDYEEGDEDECPPEETDDIIDVTATVTPIPYPTGNGNGTAPTYPTGTGAPAPSGIPTRAFRL